MVYAVDQIVDLLLKMWQVSIYTMNNEDVAYHAYQATKAYLLINRILK
ncbi:MAG: hypothetical protein ACLSFK_01135 [Streptococcus salivarius]